MLKTLDCSSQEWLERTPGLEVDGFNFWEKLKINIFDGLDREKEKIEVRDDFSFQSQRSLLPLECTDDGQRLYFYLLFLFWGGGKENARF